MDTIVMSNLAYFQLKASPGLFSLSLAPGRSRQLYAINGSAGAGTAVAGGAPDQACPFYALGHHTCDNLPP